MKIKETATIVSQKEISEGIFDLVLETPSIAGEAKAGQFVDLYSNDKSRLLPRPISLCGIDAEKKQLRLVYRAGGKGTVEFSGMKQGETIDILGPLGNGFPLEEAAGKNVYLIGGGIGVPPMLETAAQLFDAAALTAQPSADEEAAVSTAPTKIVSVLGYRSDCFLKTEFDRYGETLVATEDGSSGAKGTVLDAIAEDGRTPEVIFACGPKPMLRALKAYAVEKNIPCYVSMEERMACGVGACLGCVCKSTAVDDHTRVHNKRVCKDGPVFEAGEVDLS